MISTYHKDDMRGAVNKANREEIKPVVGCDYNVNMLGVGLKDQMLQLYLLERKKSTKWYLKLFKRLLDVALHNAMVIYRCLPSNKNMDLLFLVLYTAVHNLSRSIRDSQSDISWSVFPQQERSQNLKKMYSVLKLW
jgi:hypothetical protein